MRLSWRWLGRAILLLPLLLAVGCGGVNATGTVNPLMFLVPGMGQTAPQTIAPAVPDGTVSPAAPVQVFAQSK